MTMPEPRKRKTSPTSTAAGGEGAGGSAEVDAHLEAIEDWRGGVLRRVRAIVRRADPEMIEEIKWRKPTNPAGVITWSHGGLVCTGEKYKDKVKVTFAKGSAVPDPAGLFNASLEGLRRAIDLYEGDRLDERAFAALVREAVAVNLAKKPSGGRGAR